MRIEKGKLYAVITGDIVNSSKLPSEQGQRLHRIMEEGSKALRKAFKESVPLDADIFRGDSWQNISKINKTLKENIEDETLHPYFIDTPIGKHGSKRYGVRVEKGKIIIE